MKNQNLTNEAAKIEVFNFITKKMKSSEFCANFKIERYFDLLFYQYEKGAVTINQLATKILQS